MNGLRPSVVIVGGGLAGSLLAIMLARRGFELRVIEKRRPYSAQFKPEGRSINLALAERGIEALKHAGAYEAIAPLLIPMRGRMLHDGDGRREFRPYGQRREEQIYSVSRADLNLRLQRLASEVHGVEYRFEHACLDVEADGTLRIREPEGDDYALSADLTIAADGAGSAVRGSLQRLGAVNAQERALDHAYKEFSIPPDARGDFALEADALHIWPRGDFMLIALPNVDRSFTATLFLPKRGSPGFESIESSGIEAFMRQNFPDALQLLPDVGRQYAEHPVGSLGFVDCHPWSFLGRIVLLGDAAHAIVPFHGQGMNAAFEDCVEMDRLLARHDKNVAAAVTEFEQRRADNCRAIAEMAMQNYREMRDEVRDPRFQLNAELSFELERRFPERFIPRYSMVMFHPEIEYKEAQRRGEIQAEILRELASGIETIRDVDFRRAAEMIDERL